MKYFSAALLVLSSASMALGYAGANVLVYDVQSSDVPGTQPITVFPVPAAANMPGAQLLYDNSAHLGFSSGYATAQDRNWVASPLTAPGITINSVSYNAAQYNWDTSPVTVISPPIISGVNSYAGGQYGGWYTNTQDIATDNRFPTNIPRVGQFTGFNFTAAQFALDQGAQEFGVYTARNSNAWTYYDWDTGQWNGTYSEPDDNNLLMPAKNVWVAVLGANDTFDTAQYIPITIEGYAPFIKVTSNGVDPIKSVCVLQDANYESAPTFGFFDVYATPTPEPVSLLLISVGALVVARRRSIA